MAAWERFSTRHPDAVEVAETYGTTACEGPGRVWEWKAELKKLVGAQGKPTVNLTPASTPFRSPLDAELLEGWVEKAGDPEVYVAGHRACHPHLRSVPDRARRRAEGDRPQRGGRGSQDEGQPEELRLGHGQPGGGT